MKKLFVLFSLISLVASCSKGVEKTSAKLSLKLAGIVNLSSGIGSGGAILFGKNAAGETFGKKINSTELEIDIPNGAWVFYALMWGGESTAMNGKVHCGKSVNQLNGTATTISMSLTNDNCTDPEFSGGKLYQASNLNRFADIFIEECDEITATTGFSCGKRNQGSALSYRFVFNNFKKTSAGFTTEEESLVSECKFVSSTSTTPNVYNSGLPINFPSGGIGTPFVGSVEFFMSSTNCNVNDPKGVFRFPLRQGLATSTAPEHRVLVSSNSCSPSTPDFTSGTEESKKNKCDDFFGTWNGSNCTGTLLPVAMRFTPAALCASPVASNIAIKHQFTLPKTVLCGPYINSSSVLGAHPFAGGDGSSIRPYKICTEWQLNQIGERNTVSNIYDVFNYKLVNDLDMNKASNIPGVGVYTPPSCVGDAVTGVDRFHNLNPLDGRLCGALTSNVGFNGVFNGNNHVIANARITAEKLSQMGFVRLLGTRELTGASGTLKNIRFKNLSVRGLGFVGGLAGDTNGAGLISNVKIDGGEVEARSNYSGGAVGSSQGTGFVFENVQLKKFRIRGTDYVGGLIGQNYTSLKNSMFSGIITTDQGGSPNYAGGIAGINETTGSISSSFSEGYIGTYTNYIGGIAAKNFGTMTNIYSTMAITSLRNDPGAIQSAGITTYSDGSITNCFSDTRHMYVGGGTMTYTGTVGGGSGSVVACFTDVNNNSTHTTDTYSNLRDPAWLSSNFLTAVTTPSAWKLGAIQGVTPRLEWESRECLLNENLRPPSAQVTISGRGTQANPIVVCNATQLLAMNDRNSSEFYRLAESINLSILGVTGSTADGISMFNGKFNGDGNALYGLNQNIDNVMDGEVGIFKTIATGAVVANLNLYANRVYTSSDNVSNVGLLSRTNNGEVSNVKSYYSSVVANSFMGTLASENFGMIRDSSVTGMHMLGQSTFGGVAGTNSGTILRVRALVNMGGVASVTKAGSIAGDNLGTGVINQAEVTGFINISSGPISKVGGVVGENSGTLRNAFASRLNMNVAINSSASEIGGIVGQNTAGIVDKTFFIGQILGTQSPGDLTAKVDTDGTTDERTLGPIVGKRVAGTITTSLSANDYLVWGPSSMTVSSCNLGTDTIVVTSGSFSGSTGALAHHSSPFLVPFAHSSNILTLPIATLLGVCPANGESLALFSSYRNYAEHGEVTTIPDFKNLANFITKGFDITLDDDNRAIGYHLALMNGTPMPANVPVWTLEEDSDHPKLLQLEH